MGKTLAELQADWVTHGHISALNTKLFGESNDAKRKILEEQIAAARATLKPDPG